MLRGRIKLGKAGFLGQGGQGGPLCRGYLRGERPKRGGSGGSWGRGSGSRKRGRQDCARGAPRQRGGWGEGSATRQTQESRFAQSSLGKDLGATLEGEGQVVRPLCRTNEQQLPKSKIRMSSEEANQSPSGINPAETQAPVTQDFTCKGGREPRGEEQGF